MKVLGVDPGTVVTGYGLLECPRPGRGTLIECGVIRATRGAPLARRLADVYDGVQHLIATHRPTALALETVFYNKNVRSTVTLGQAHGVVLLAGQQAGLDIALYAPALVKKTVVGVGRAGKAQVGYMVAKLLRLEHAPFPSDAADGVAVALTHVLRHR